MLEHKFRIDDGSLPQIGEDGTPDVLLGVVKVHEDGIDHVVKGRLRQFDVPAAEEHVDGCSHLQPDRILRIVQSLQHHGVQFPQFLIADLLSK